MYGLSEHDLDAPDARPRPFADELIPRGEAEMDDGELPPERCSRRTTSGRSSSASTPPTCRPRVRRPGVHHAPAGARPGAGRPGHQRARLVHGHAARVVGRRGHRRTRASAGCCRRRAARCQECYAITEEDAGSDVADLAATARRDGDDYVLDGVKWHVTSYNEADYAFFQAVLDRRHAHRRARPVRGRPARRRGPRRAHPGVHAHHRPRTPDRGIRGRPGARATPRRRRGRRHDVRLRVVPLRATDGRGAMPRCRRPTRRGDDGVRRTRIVAASR